MQNKLLPCPFCGGEAQVIGHYIKGGANNYQYFVRCSKCKTRPMPYNTYKKKELAMEKWNTRKPMERIVEQLEDFAECKNCKEKEIDKKFYYGQGCKACVWKKVIDIVKEGGTDEE